LGLRDRFPHPYTRRDAEEWLALTTGQQPPLNFAIVFQGGPIGGIGLELYEDVLRGCGELGYWLGEEHWGRGLATEAVRAVVPYAFEKLELRRLQALAYAANVASARVLEKAGFQLEGTLRRQVVKDGRVMDALLYSRLRDDPE
jgi:RimJ/RimL family protein N-acetyltransferase